MFTIAHISDLHVTVEDERAMGVVDTRAFLAAAVERIAAFAPDALVITGDLVESGRAEEYAELKRLLAPLTMPIYVIPGNHDDRGAFFDAFGELASSTAAPYFQWTADCGPLRLIGLDTLIPGDAGGRLCTTRLDWLAAELARPPRRPTVLLLHHPPFETGLTGMDAYGLFAPGLGELIERHPEIDRILCGHLHRPIHRRWHGTVVSVCPSTAHQVALDAPAIPSWRLEPPALYLHAWCEGALVTHLAPIGDYGPAHPF